MSLYVVSQNVAKYNKPNNVIVEISLKNNTQNIQTLDVNFAEHSNIL